MFYNKLTETNYQFLHFVTINCSAYTGVTPKPDSLTGSYVFYTHKHTHTQTHAHTYRHLHGYNYLLQNTAKTTGVVMLTGSV